VRASLIIALLCFAAIAATAGEREDLIIRYQKETSELAKRDLALKMIDSGAIRLFDTTVTEIAKVFGKDWQPVGALGKGRSRGFVNFAQQPTPPPEKLAIQVPSVGSYLMIDYLTDSGQVEKWCVSNQHK